MKLPETMTAKASLEGSEYAWKIRDFPSVLKEVVQHGLACVGGQFQFRLADGPICEMYWLNADASPRRQTESWVDYTLRCQTEVAQMFQKLCAEIDFRHEAESFEFLRQKCEAGFDPLPHLCFVAYFDQEPRST